MNIILSENTELRTLQEYLGKLNEIDDILNKILSKEILINSKEQKSAFKSIKKHLVGIGYSTEYVTGDLAKMDRIDQVEISELKERIGLKYYLLFMSLFNDISPKEKFDLNRSIMGSFDVYQSTFNQFLRFEDANLLKEINKTHNKT